MIGRKHKGFISTYFSDAKRYFDLQTTLNIFKKLIQIMVEKGAKRPQNENKEGKRKLSSNHFSAGWFIEHLNYQVANSRNSSFIVNLK